MAGRPKSDNDIVARIKQELGKRYKNTKKLDLIARALVNAALPRNKEGQISLEESAVIDHKSVSILFDRLYGKPAENRRTAIDIFHHYPELEKKVNLDEYKVIEAEAKVIEEN